MWRLCWVLFISLNYKSQFGGSGFIAGQDDGIVSVSGKPASRQVFALEQKTLRVVRSTWSDENGHYCLPNLDSHTQFIVMALDFKGQYEPVCYDQVMPFHE